MANDTLHLSFGTVGMSTNNGHKPCDLLTAARHNLRELQWELSGDGPIDPDRVGDNVTLAGPATADGVKALADELLNTAGLKRDHIQAIEAVFSLPPGSPIEPLAYFAQCLEWLRVALPFPVLLATVHMDESAPHMHVLQRPVSGGKYIGGQLTDKPKVKRLRDSFFVKVAGPAGLKRQGAKVFGKVKAWATREVLAQCEAQGLPASMGPLWDVFVADVKRDPTPHMLALGIDPNTLRPDDGAPPRAIALQPRAIALSPRAIALQKEGPKIKEQSCVALLPGGATLTPAQVHIQAPPPAPAIATLDELWVAVGCRSLLITPTQAEQHKRHELVKQAAERRARIASAEAERHRTKPERLQLAQAAIQTATARHTTRTTGSAGAAHHHGHQTTRVTDGDLTRERDDYAHECPWDY